MPKSLESVIRDSYYIFQYHCLNHHQEGNGSPHDDQRTIINLTIL